MRELTIDLIGQAVTAVHLVQLASSLHAFGWVVSGWSLGKRSCPGHSGWLNQTSDDVVMWAGQEKWAAG